MEILSITLGIIGVLSFLSGLFGIYRALDNRITVLEATHKLKMNDVDAKILQLREDMKEQMILFKEELKNHTQVNSDIIISLKQDHKELVSNFKELNDTMIKLNTILQVTFKEKGI